MASLTFDDLLDKHVLAGLTFVSTDGEVLRQVQFHGPVLRASDRGVVVRRTDTGAEFTLPPDLSAYRVAAPGDYRLRGSGEVVSNPDIVTTWRLEVQERGVHNG